MTIKRTIPALALAVMLAVTGCASEQAGTAVAGGVAAAPAASSRAAEPSAPAPTEQSPTEESPTEETTTDDGGTPAQPGASVADPTQSPTSEQTTSEQTTEEKTTEDVPEGGGIPADMCDLLSAQYSKGKTKDDSRDPAVTCTYTNTEDGFKSASITTGFAPDDGSIKQQYNLDVKELEIDGRPGYTYFYGSDRTLAVATFVLADPQSGLQCQIQDDTMKPAQLTETVTALCTAASKKLPRG